MPYISEQTRDNLIPYSESSATTPGELNFQISILIDQYLHRKGKNYENLNAVIGVLSCAKMEYYRRIAAPYEDEKIQQNGDVFQTR